MTYELLLHVGFTPGSVLHARARVLHKRLAVIADAVDKLEGAGWIVVEPARGDHSILCYREGDSPFASEAAKPFASEAAVREHLQAIGIPSDADFLEILEVDGDDEVVEPEDADEQETLIDAEARWNAEAGKVCYYAQLSETEAWIEITAEEFANVTRGGILTSANLVCAQVCQTADHLREVLEDFLAFRKNVESAIESWRSPTSTGEGN
jgi:hypothetical protein